MVHSIGKQALEVVRVTAPVHKLARGQGPFPPQTPAYSPFFALLILIESSDYYR